MIPLTPLRMAVASATAWPLTHARKMVQRYMTHQPHGLRRVVLKEQGDEHMGRRSSDVALVVREELHPQFERKGDDLLTRVEVPLVQALTCEYVEVPLLDGDSMEVRSRSMLSGTSGEHKQHLHLSVWQSPCTVTCAPAPVSIQAGRLVSTACTISTVLMPEGGTSA